MKRNIRIFVPIRLFVSIRVSAILLISQAFYQRTVAQELFVFTEPASNMPAHSIGIRMSNWLTMEKANSMINYQLVPEIMFGVNKNLMLHTEVFSSNQNGTFRGEGAGFYGKYRLYTSDQVNRHFRLAAFGQLSYNKRDIVQEEIDLKRSNSGYGLGLIATQLLHKQAISSTFSFVRATNNDLAQFPNSQADKALNLALSTGRLIFPKEYTSYKQANVNLMLELLGQQLLGTTKAYLDLAPAIQFIFFSQLRVDIGYKVQLYSNMERNAPNGFMLRVEHLLFNVL